jgi:hypothetical protein
MISRIICIAICYSKNESGILFVNAPQKQTPIRLPDKWVFFSTKPEPLAHGSGIQDEFYADTAKNRKNIW